MKHFVVAVDFDGTLAVESEDGFLVPTEGAKEALEEIQAQGAVIVIHTCRVMLARREGTLDMELNGLRQWLLDHEIPFDSIDLGDKPVATFYIDDRGISFDGSWKKSLAELKQKIGNRGE